MPFTNAELLDPELQELLNQLSDTPNNRHVNDDTSDEDDNFVGQNVRCCGTNRQRTTSMPSMKTEPKPSTDEELREIMKNIERLNESVRSCHMRYVSGKMKQESDSFRQTMTENVTWLVRKRPRHVYRRPMESHGEEMYTARMRNITAPRDDTKWSVSENERIWGSVGVKKEVQEVGNSQNKPTTFPTAEQLNELPASFPSQWSLRYPSTSTQPIQPPGHLRPRTTIAYQQRDLLDLGANIENWQVPMARAAPVSSYGRGIDTDRPVRCSHTNTCRLCRYDKLMEE